MAESSNRRKQIFLEALELPAPADRSAFLARACADDDALRREIEAMLQGHAAADSFLEKPAAALAAGDPDATGARKSRPQPLPRGASGRTSCCKQIGEGGMGVVYMAEQEQPVRRRWR